MLTEHRVLVLLSSSICLHLMVASLVSVQPSPTGTALSSHHSQAALVLPIHQNETFLFILLWYVTSNGSDPWQREILRLAEKGLQAALFIVVCPAYNQVNLTSAHAGVDHLQAGG